MYLKKENASNVVIDLDHVFKENNSTIAEL